MTDDSPISSNTLFLGNAAEVFRHYRGTCTCLQVLQQICMFVCMCWWGLKVRQKQAQREKKKGIGGKYYIIETRRIYRY